jgi:hypothetical protein
MMRRLISAAGFPRVLAGCLGVALLLSAGASPAGAADPVAAADAPVAQEGQPDRSKTPWLEGVSIPPHPPLPSPTFPAEIMMPDGSGLPASLSEDVPFVVSVQSDIFGAAPPTEWAGKSYPKAAWAGNPSVRWFLDDVSKNSSTLASAEEVLPMNQMKITPLQPMETGGVTVTIGRPLSFEIAPGRVIKVFANASRSLTTKIGDITPPTCGLEISVGGKTASIWTIETPPHQYPPPKTAAVYLKGSLWQGVQEGEEKAVATIELGKQMRLTKEQAQLVLPKTGDIKIQALVQDNFQLDEDSVKFGLGEWSGDAPVLTGEPNPATLNPDAVKIPAEPVLFVEARDKAGNLSILAVPVVFP